MTAGGIPVRCSHGWTARQEPKTASYGWYGSQHKTRVESGQSVKPRPPAWQVRSRVDVSLLQPVAPRPAVVPAVLWHLATVLWPLICPFSPP